MVKTLHLIAVAAVLGGPGATGAGAQSGTHDLFGRVMSDAKESGLYQASFDAILQEVGLRFLGFPYAAGLLDKSPEEELVVDLTRFECVLFIEHVLAISQGIAARDYAFDSFARRVEKLRYRSETRDGYCSRLHYFTEWISDNRATVEDITERIGGEDYEKSLTFMSEHRESYPLIAGSDSLFRGIQSMEAALRGSKLRHVPEGRIRSVYGHLRSGDIVAMTTHIRGLDVVHSGMVLVQEDGSVGLLHASPRGGVIVSPDLATYVQGQASQIGIVVARPIDPRNGGS